MVAAPVKAVPPEFNKVKLEPYLIKVWDDKKLRLFNFKKENNLI